MEEQIKYSIPLFIASKVIKRTRTVITKIWEKATHHPTGATRSSNLKQKSQLPKNELAIIMNEYFL
jgi:hypothetical protein